MKVSVHWLYTFSPKVAPPHHETEVIQRKRERVDFRPSMGFLTDQPLRRKREQKR